ncbi:T9SS type A sorting domain-containing protein [Rhodonellum ikkaensis]|nr:T9SS type A sorting domain-containing protein [Rhodonellum ikkaensis]
MTMLFCFAFVAYLQAQSVNTECEGTSTEASDGAFTDGFKYRFTTNGTNITATFELLESKDGLVAFAQTYNPNFSERPMTQVEGNKFSLTFAGQTPGSTFRIACKFAFAGGLATTKILEYTVGTDCGNTLLNLPVDFENTTLDYQLVDFGGNASEIVADPTNPQNRVVKSIKTVGAEVWAGTTIGDASGFASAIPFKEGSTTMSVRVWSPKAGIPIRLKVEQAGNTDVSVETQTNSIIANEWQTLVFDFASPVEGAALDFAKQYNKVSIFFDFGTNGGAGEQTYYWDEVVFIAAEELDLPVDFESTTINYELTDFGGNISEIVADPTNADNKVVKIIKPLDAAGWAGTTIGGNSGFAKPVPFAVGATGITLRVWSPDAGTPVRIKIENYLNVTQSIETETNTSLAGEWETLVFNFANQAQGTEAINYDLNFNKASVFMNFGTEGNTAGEKTYYFDDMIFVGSVGGENPVDSALPVIPLDFESTSIEYGFENFAGGDLTRIANPQSNGINTSAFVGRMVKNAGEVYAGTLIPLATPIDFSQSKTFKVKVYMPRVGAKLLLKVENQSNPAISFEKEVTGTKANEWEELSFDYSGINPSESYQKLVLIFDLGTMGDGSANFTYLIDDVLLVAEGNGGGVVTVGQMDLPVTFDNEEVTYGLVGFGGADGTIVVDPTDANNKVARIIKSVDAQSWAGTTVTAVTEGVETGFANKIPFTAQNKKMSVRVWSPDAGIPVRLKVENYLSVNQSVETETKTTLAGQWETLVFDFANQAQGTEALNLALNFNKASLFFNFGTEGATAGEKTYYFDDIVFGTSATENPVTGQLPVIPMDFESGELAYDFLNFEGGELSRIANPQSSGINTSGFVAQMVKNPGEVFAGAVIPLASAIDFSKGKIFKVKVYMPRVGAKLLLKVENQTDGGIAFEKEVTGTKANEWEELTFDYSGINTLNSYQKVVLIFDLGTAGDGSANFTYLVDDIALVSDGENPVTSQLPVIPLDFESGDLKYDFLNFEGSELTRVFNPQVGGINTSGFVGQMIKYQGAVFAGTLIQLASPIDFSQGKIFKVKVFMPRVGAKLLLKVENQTNSEIAFEKEVAGTKANEWEELTFDYEAINTTNSYQKVVLIFDLGTVGDGSANFTYLLDDISLVADGSTPVETLAQMNVPVTFDGENVNYGLVGFGGADASSIVQDPTNSANKVAKVTKSDAAELWAGTTVTATSNGVQTGFSSKIPFTAENKKLSVRVWSPDAGIPVRLKVENHLNNEESVETETSTTVAGNWETLSFDFDNQVEGTAEFNISSSYNKLSIFFNFGKTGAEAGEKTYYFDDIEFGEQVACVNPPKPVITMTGVGTETIILTSSASEGNQWFFNGVIIPGANGMTLSVTDFGVFTVQVTLGDCKSEISNGTVLIVNGSEIRPIGSIRVFPNPTVDYVEVHGMNGALRSLEIIDMTGRSYAIPFVQIGDVYQVNMSGLSPGVYVLWIQQGNESFRTKIIKK